MTTTNNNLIQQELTDYQLRILNGFQKHFLEDSSPRHIRDSIVEFIVDSTNSSNEGTNIKELSGHFYMLGKLYKLMNELEYGLSLSPSQFPHVTEYNLAEYIHKSLSEGKSFQINTKNEEIRSYSYSYEKQKGIIGLRYNKERGINACMEDDIEMSLKDLSEEVLKNWANVVRIF